MIGDPVVDAARGAEWLRSRGEPVEAFRADEQAECLRRVYELADHRAEIVDEHRRLLDRTAYRAGVEVGAGRLTVGDAERQLDRLVRVTFDEATVPMHVVPFDQGAALVRDRFAAGVDVGHRQLLRGVA